MSEPAKYGGDIRTRKLEKGGSCQTVGFCVFNQLQTERKGGSFQRKTRNRKHFGTRVLKEGGGTWLRYYLFGGLFAGEREDSGDLGIGKFVYLSLQKCRGGDTPGGEGRKKKRKGKSNFSGLGVPPQHKK